MWPRRDHQIVVDDSRQKEMFIFVGLPFLGLGKGVVGGKKTYYNLEAPSLKNMFRLLIGVR